MNCRKCNALIDKESKFCPYCGEATNNNEIKREYDDPFKDLRIDNTHASQYNYQQNYSNQKPITYDSLNTKPKNNISLIGLILGAGAGFVSCFLGDLLGFFVNTGGNGYFPWVGISVGTVAFISGVVFHCFKSKSTFSLYLKITVVSVLTFLICSVGINTTAFWISFSSSTYFEYLFSRYILKGQLLVSVINYALVFVVVPVFKRMSFFKGLNL